MSNGQGNISFSEPTGSSGGGGGGTLTGADNGLSLNGTVVVLGNDVGDGAEPSILLNDRVIPMAGFSLSFLGAGLNTNFFDIDSGSVAMLNYFKGETGQQPFELVTIQGQAPGGNPYGNFWSTLDESFTNPDGQTDAVWQWGYNQNGTGGRVVANEAAIWWSMESAFESGLSAQFEIELQSVSKDGNSRRHLQLDVNKGDGNAVGTWTAGSWEWFNDNSVVNPYFAISGPNGGMVLQGTSPIFNMINLDPTQGQFVIESNNDGSVNISNQATGANPIIQIANPIIVDNTDTAQASFTAELDNHDGIQGFLVTGVVSAGSGTAYVFRSEASASGATLLFNENTGTGDSYVIARAAVGAGNAIIQVGNGDASKVFSIGLLQSSGNLIITDSTSVASGANLLTVTKTAQVGFGGEAAPTAFVHIAASGGTAGAGPLKLTAAPLLPVPEDGLIEYDGTNFWKTIGAVRTVIV